MEKINVWIVMGCMIAFTLFQNGCATVKHDGRDVVDSSQPTVELADGDRVVFLGNSLFEYDGQHGYVEYALTSRFPDRDVIFRNLGWSGDTVFAESRGYFTPPPTAYEHMIEQLTHTQPTIVFIAYGANEALEGEEGITPFLEGLNQLLDEIDKLEARAILLSPIPHFSYGSPVADSRPFNETLERYSIAISQTASERNIPFIDLFNGLHELGEHIALTDNGIHLNEMGYYYLAANIEKGLGFSPRSRLLEIDVSGGANMTSDPGISGLNVEQDRLEFTVEEALLPIPRPESDSEWDDPSYTIKISGLADGEYSLSMDGEWVARASAREWSQGVDIQSGGLFSQARELRDLIVEKNEMFFQQYRPQNRTYLLGFRSYEQGHIADELQHYDSIISRLEDQIVLLRRPEPMIYQLTSVK